MSLNKIILTTGSNGAIGSELKQVVPANVELISTSNKAIGDLHLDVTNLNEVRNRISLFKPDKIFHLAAVVPIPLIEKDPDKAFLINVLGLNNVLKAVEEIHPSCQVIVISSSEVYGSGTSRKKFLETDSFNPNNFYAFTKVSQEQLATLYIKRGLNIKIARVFNYSSIYKEPIYSLESFANQIGNLIKLGGDSVIKVGNLEPERDFLQGIDVAKALYNIAFTDKNTMIYNVCRGDVTSMRELLNKIINAFGVKIDVIKDESKFRLIDSTYVCGDNTRLLATGWTPTYGIDEMIRILVREYKAKLAV